MPRTYTEREIAALLARASERQRASMAADGAPGLSLDEVVRAAAEAGLDPAHVRAAAAEIDAGAVAAPPPARPGAVSLERWADAPLTEAAWEEAVHVLRARFGPSTGETGLGPAGPDTARVGAAYEWTHQSLGGLRTVVSVSPRGDRTRLRLAQTEWGAVGDRATATILAGLASLLLAFGSAAVVIGADAGPLALWLVPLLVFMAGIGVGTVVGTPAVRRQRERRAARAAEVLAAVEAAVVSFDADRDPELDADRDPDGSDPTSVAEAPGLDPSLLDPPDTSRDAEDGGPARSRTRA